MGSRPVTLDIHWLQHECGLRQLPVVCWDLDSTIADTSHRQWMLDNIKGPQPTLTWDDYSGACALDRPLPGSVRMASILAGSHLQLILTGRNESARSLTVHWLLEHNVPIDGILMRPTGLHADNADLKIQWIELLREAGADIRLFLEDWDDCGRKIEAQTGVPVLGVNPFYQDANGEAPKDGFLPALPGQLPPGATYGDTVAIAAMERG